MDASSRGSRKMTTLRNEPITAPKTAARSVRDESIMKLSLLIMVNNFILL
jgi:hypothetical protein